MVLVQNVGAEIHAVVCGHKFVCSRPPLCHVARMMMSSGQEGDSVSASQCSQSHCALCNKRLRDAHSHPGQWKSELQQFLLSYSAIPLSSCVCKANKRSLRRGLSGRFYPTMGEAKD